ncbi:MAG: response regulator transcription factor [Armatimonadetes bacterium]|nr:response regulator transcription factor [Armatimonadota bacterium]
MVKKGQNANTKGVSVVICDRQPLFRLGLRLAIEQMGNLCIVGEAEDFGELLDIFDRVVPQILVMDMTVARSESFQLLRHLKVRFPSVKVVLTVPKSVNPIELAGAIQVGVAACLFRDSPPNLVRMALQSVMSGKPWIQREFAEHIIQVLNSLPISDEPIRSLTEKERQVLILLAKGMTNKEIAKYLGVSLQTVKTHVSRILQKLRVRSRAEAARYTLALLRSSFDGERTATLIRHR